MSDVDRTLHTLFETNRLLRDAGEVLAASAGQTHARRMVLQAAGAGATVPAIARTLGLHRQGVQRIADELVRDGLGRYGENPRHRLSKLFEVTASGAAALSAISRAHARWIGGLEAAGANVDWIALERALNELLRILRVQAPATTTDRQTP